MKKIAQCRNFENLNKRYFRGAGKYNIPVIDPEPYEGCDFIGFNYASSCKRNRENTGIHFYLDDYQFQRVWNMIDYYLPMLSDFKYVLTPDFSLYADFPLPMQIYNHYRKHWVGAYLQEKGIKVIPTIAWSDESSFEWCFDGEPAQGAVSVSAIGTQMNRITKKNFLDGYNEMLRRLEPETILFYGKVPDGCTGNIICIPAYQDKFDKADGGG